MTTTAGRPDAESGHHATDQNAPRPEVTVMGRDIEGGPLPPLRERMCPPMPGRRAIGWLGPLLVALFAGTIRIWNLGVPAKFVFDETYYPKDALSLLLYGVEHQHKEGANEKILNGVLEPGKLFGDGAFVVHPPAGKWVIAAGEWLFGMNPFGWRFAVAFLGALSVLMLARIVRRMTRSTLLGCVAGLLLALDGLHFVESRIALIDLPLMFWLIAAFGCLLLDRDWARDRLAVAVEPLGRVQAGGWGPTLLWRPWRLAAGVCFGLAASTKWNALFVLAAFGLLTFAWDLGARYAIGVKLHLDSFLRAVVDAAVAFGTVVGTAFLSYLATWTGWFASDEGWDRRWAENNPPSGLLANLLPDSLRSLLHYHVGIFEFHTDLTEDHPYESNPIGWLVVGRPVAFDWTDGIGPDQGCPTNECVREILAIGTPAIWWAGVLALAACLVFWLAGRDWRFGVPVLGVAATWLPWFMYTERPIFYFYAVVILPWMVIAVTLALGKILGPGGATARRRMWGAAFVGGYVLLVVLNFAYLHPILTAETIPKEAWLDRMWFSSWS